MRGHDCLSVDVGFYTRPPPRHILSDLKIRFIIISSVTYAERSCPLSASQQKMYTMSYCLSSHYQILANFCHLFLQYQPGPAVQPGPVWQREAVQTDPQRKSDAGHQEAARHGEASFPPQLSRGGGNRTTKSSFNIWHDLTVSFQMVDWYVTVRQSQASCFPLIPVFMPAMLTVSFYSFIVSVQNF